MAASQWPRAKGQEQGYGNFSLPLYCLYTPASVKICPIFALHLWRKVLPLPLLMAKSHKPGANSQKPSIHAGGNNLTTTREVSSNTHRCCECWGGNCTLHRTPQRSRTGSQPSAHPLDVEMIAHYAKQGYRPLQPHEIDYAEFRQ